MGRNTDFRQGEDNPIRLRFARVVCRGFERGRGERALGIWSVQGKGKRKGWRHGCSLHDDGAIAVLGLLCRDALQSAVPVSNHSSPAATGRDSPSLQRWPASAAASALAAFESPADARSPAETVSGLEERSAAPSR